jgi:hypothetical protein
MTENDLKELGWKLVKKGFHGKYTLTRYELGFMQIEFFYENGTLLGCDLTPKEIFCMPVNLKQAKILTQLFTEGHE